MLKTCSQCKEKKEFSEFRKATKEKDGFQHACRICANISTKAWRERNRESENISQKKRRATNPEKYNAMGKRWRDANPDKVKTLHLKKRYSLTLEQWNVMFSEQLGRCRICDIHQNDLKMELAVDHDHTSGRIRGLLCVRCNRAIGLLEDRVDLLQKAINHLSL